MGRFDNIKTAIDTNINTNGNQAITGAVMNSVMKQTVDSVDTQLTELESELGTYDANINPEYIRAYTDGNGMFLWGIRKDGSIEWAVGVPTPIKKYVEQIDSFNDAELNRLNQLIVSLKEQVDNYGIYFLENPEYIRAITDADGKVLIAINRNGELISPFQQFLLRSEDVEDRIERTEDAKGKIISYRDKKGVKHECVGIKTQNLDVLGELGESVKKKIFEQTMLGLRNRNNIENSTDIRLPLPRKIAYVNLITPNLPTTKADDIQGHLEYSDGDGNYFKIPIIINAQGSSSMGFSQIEEINGQKVDIGKNISLDIVSEDFSDDGIKIKFGEWVSQDSFHIKKFYHDVFRGQCVVGYHLIEQMYKTRPYNEQRAWSYLYKNDNIYDSNGKFAKDFNSGAMGHPDGFPIEMHWNGTFIGVYSWCLKKHRDNYNCKKDDANAIILDGVLNSSTIFNGDINWTQFELRNPKTLYCMDGSKYDGDEPKELIDSTSAHYNPNNADHVNSAKAKSAIQRFANAKSVIASDGSRETIEQYFNVPFFIDYYLFSNVVYHHDGFAKNWIWCTWDGKMWSPMVYDVDSIFGSAAWTGNNFVIRGSESGLLPGTFTDFLRGIYKSDMKARYVELRKKGVFSVANIVGLLSNWIDKIGYETLKADLAYFVECPSYRDSKINKGWDFLGLSESSVETYDESKTYNIGDRCNYGIGSHIYCFSANENNVSLAPLSGFYTQNPFAMGYYNSIQRVENWLTKRIEYMDSYFDYVETNL